MFGREELETFSPSADEFGEPIIIGGHDLYRIDDADKVMDAMERRIVRQASVIAELHKILAGNWEHWQKANAELEQKFTIINAEQNKRIKGLEEDLEQANRLVAVLEASQPKWISVVERLPTKEDADVDGDVLASNHVYPRGLFCHYGDIHKLGITHWLYNLQPPTTEKSSSVEEG